MESKPSAMGDACNEALMTAHAPVVSSDDPAVPVVSASDSTFFWRRVAKESAMIALILAFASGILWILAIGCPIKFMTGLSCPGCGMSRAWLAAATLHFEEAFAYHPLFWTIPVIVIAAVALQAGHTSKALRIVLVVAGMAVVALWIARMFIDPDCALLFDSAGGPLMAEDIVNWQIPRWLDLLI